MAADHIDPTDQGQETDLLAQQTPLERPDLTNGGPDILDSPKEVDEVDRWEQAVRCPAARTTTTHTTASRRCAMTDPLGVARCGACRCRDHTTFTEVLAVVDECSRDLDAPGDPALGELLERLARQRLAARHVEPDHIRPRRRL